jgi:hypothetical protein
VLFLDTLFKPSRNVALNNKSKQNVFSQSTFGKKQAFGVWKYNANGL